MRDSRTEIYITIDTEFSIAGHFADPEKYQPIASPVVTCPVENTEHGLGFLLNTFEQFDIAATFFVETANACFFGDQPMQEIVKRIKKAQQDIQLHVHPVWLSFLNNADTQYFPQNDNCANRTFEELKNAFELCIERFEKWVGQTPLAIRTGSLWTDLNVYKVMEALSIPMASNIALGVFTPEEAKLQHYSGRKSIQNVLELPVFTYQDFNFFGKKNLKSLQITSCSWPEMKYLLWQARRHSIESIVILTHPFEFIKKADFQYNKLTRNRVNQTRLKNLCQFIQEHDQDFVSSDFSQCYQRWGHSELHQPIIEIPSYYSICRRIHNKINDTIWSY